MFDKLFGIKPQPLQSQSHFFTSETSLSDATPDSIKNTSSSFYAGYGEVTLQKRDQTSLAQIVSRVRDSMPDGTKKTSPPIGDAMVTRKDPLPVGERSNFLLPTASEVRWAADRAREEAYGALTGKRKVAYLLLSNEQREAYVALTPKQREDYWSEMKKAELAVLETTAQEPALSKAASQTSLVALAPVAEDPAIPQGPELSKSAGMNTEIKEILQDYKESQLNKNQSQDTSSVPKPKPRTSLTSTTPTPLPRKLASKPVPLPSGDAKTIA